MPKGIVPLTDLQVIKAKPKTKQYKLFDGGGLFLLVTPSGGKLWRLKYRFDGKERLMSFGSHPEISIANAREKRDAARKQLANGISPGEALKAQKAVKGEQDTNSFEVIAREWHAKFTPKFSPDHAKKIMSSMQRDLFPYIGARPISEIKAKELLTTLERLESRGVLETAHRVRNTAGQVFRYAVVTGRADRDPSVDLRGALPSPKKRHYGAVTEPKAAAGLLRAIDGFQGSFIVKSALQLAAMFFVRPGELRYAEWSEFDFIAAIWSIPAEKMKMKQAHIVPLSQQAIAILNELKPLTGHSLYVFPCHRSPSRCMSNNAINAALRRMGYDKEEMTGHGFRAMARTILDEVLHVRPDFIEHQLAHAVKDPNGRAYNRTAHLDERKKMMQQWSDYLDGLKAVHKGSS